ncbi:unnamed protein product [Fraxinus pennsylvanica]|uniref:Uncharacterized protein n=1 Tax=Fraxinus pennsylvanica TaxID=56036 RepID=A0AAD1YNR8_9LAMI|nr:unnamed protein product [Fraxinus pennsylvanica]
MRAILVQQRVAKAIDDPALFLTKTLPNKIYLLEKLFSFKMDSGKNLEANLSDFSILVKSLAHNGKKFDDEDFAVIFLNSLPDSFKDIKNAIKYSRDALTQTIVTNALRLRELEIRKNLKQVQERRTCL